jgi:hypothetical protein
LINEIEASGFDNQGMRLTKNRPSSAVHPYIDGVRNKSDRRMPHNLYTNEIEASGFDNQGMRLTKNRPSSAVHPYIDG